jgi:hypothetical protein
MIVTALRTWMFAAALALLSLTAETTAAQESKDALYESFTITPATPTGQTPRWQKKVVFYLHRLSDERHRKSRDFLADLMDRDPNDDVLFDSLIYVSRLTSKANLDWSPSIDGNRAVVLLFEAEDVEVPRIIDPQNQAIAFIRKDSNAKRLCSLSVQWRDRAIQMPACLAAP